VDRDKIEHGWQIIPAASSGWLGGQKVTQTGLKEAHALGVVGTRPAGRVSHWCLWAAWTPPRRPLCAACAIDRGVAGWARRAEDLGDGAVKRWLCPLQLVRMKSGKEPWQRLMGAQCGRRGLGQGVAEPASKGAHDQADRGGQRVCKTGLSGRGGPRESRHCVCSYCSRAGPGQDWGRKGFDGLAMREREVADAWDLMGAGKLVAGNTGWVCGSGP
jgi:hypothetical protein